ncbi:hypothetical protein, partial [Paenibacillus rhizoplanae]
RIVKIFLYRKRAGYLFDNLLFCCFLTLHLNLMTLVFIHLIPAQRPLSAESGVFIHLIPALRSLSAQSGVFIHLIPAQCQLSANSGAFLHLIPALRPLLVSGAG